MKKRYNLGRIKGQRIYDFSMIAKCLGIHQRTVQLWHRQGLRCVNEGSKPCLIHGTELKKFLGEKQASRQCKLKADELYCCKCNKATQAVGNSLKIIETGKRVGTALVQVIVQGKCIICGSNISRLSVENEDESKCK
jgi:phage terminase Nu1 subunit (DNA packaging protein)